MSRMKPDKQEPDALILNVNKPPNMSSYDVVRVVKKILPGVKVGHAGTLDPFAEGVLLILIGRATKRMAELLGLRKRYEAVLQLGFATTTGDPTGIPTESTPVPELTAEQLDQVARNFKGEILQVPPPFSAKKVEGKRAYRLARRGQPVNLTPVKVSVYELKLTMLDDCRIKLEVECSSGTYIRRLGENIAKALGTCGHLSSLKRTRIGDYRVDNSVTIEQLPEFLASFSGVVS
jgi:tRNA pseudouridine55 synthase